MKKIFALCLCFLFIGIINAEKCTVVTGDGSHLGDEIACGTEHFYIIKANNDTTKLLSKYNLLAGDKIDAIKVNENEWPANDVEEYEFCENLAHERGYNPYLVYPRSDKLLCRVYEKMTPEHIRQDAKAEGTKIANNDSVLPIYGIGYMVPEWGYDAIHNGVIHTTEYDNDGNMIIENSNFEEYINGYKQELKSQEIDVVSVGMPVINTIKDFLEGISGREVVSNFEGDIFDVTNPDAPYFYTEKMDIKGYIPDKYSWLYDRAYWLGSGFAFDNTNNGDYYISNEGYLCLMGRGTCFYFPYPIGNGIRPLVTINTKDIEFKITTKTDGHGKIKAEKIQAREGEVIKFTIIPDEGYVLGEVKVTDANGNVIVFKDYTFTMPNANVLIEATFVKKSIIPINPETTTFGLLIVIICGLISGSIHIYLKRKQKNKVV